MLSSALDASTFFLLTVLHIHKEDLNPLTYPHAIHFLHLTISLSTNSYYLIHLSCLDYSTSVFSNFIHFNLYLLYLTLAFLYTYLHLTLIHFSPPCLRLLHCTFRLSYFPPPCPYPLPHSPISTTLHLLTIAPHTHLSTVLHLPPQQSSPTTSQSASSLSLSHLHRHCLPRLTYARLPTLIHVHSSLSIMEA